MSTTLALAEFQNGFANGLIGEQTYLDAAHPMAAVFSQPGFTVYRNTVLKACVDALASNYPAILKLVGEQWFRAAATIYASHNLPTTPTLLYYGASFADFLRDFEPAADLPYLAGVAQLDRYWSEAHGAADGTPVLAESLALLSPERVTETAFKPHPSARWAWFADKPIATLWQRNTDRPGVMLENQNDELDWCAEGMLIVRPHDSVIAMPLQLSGCTFLDACGQGQPLGEAATIALTTDPSTDISQQLAVLLQAGALIENNNS